VELYEGHGFNNGPNNINENGGGDDIDLGSVPGSWAVTVPSNPSVNYGAISSTTGVFVAGPETTQMTGNATVRFSLGTLSSTRIHRTVPPDWVTPAAPPPTGAVALFGPGGTALSWVNPVPYDRITIRRLGQIVGLLSGMATSFVDTTAWGLSNYTITGELGGYIPATVSVAAVAAPYQVTLADNDSVAVNLNFLFFWYGQAYGSLHVTSNGRITFGSAGISGAADYAGTADSFVSGPASFGCWTDLDPSLGGTITVDNQVSSIRIVYSNIPHKAWPSATASFTIELTTAGTARITGLSQSLFPVNDNLILGGGPGNNVSTSPSLDFSSILPILGGTPVNSNVAEDFPAGNLIDVTGVLFIPVIGTNSRSFRVLQV
jgi:hypothetical protein